MDETQTTPLAAPTPGEQRRLVRLAFRYCWNTGDAEDAVQNALVVALRKAAQLRDREKYWAWLCRIVIQQCRLLHRRRPRAAEFADIDQVPAASAAEHLSQRELGELMKAWIVHLPHKQRVALSLRHFERLDYPQIAAIMNIRESTARVHVRAGREALRRLILARHPEWTP